jgi:cysteinyl-tRNA synthetase
VVTIRRVAETHDLEALRLLLISVHYRSPANFTIARDGDGQAVYPDLDEAEARLDYFYRTLERVDAFLVPIKLPESIPPSKLAEDAGAAMDDDFNTAAAIGHLYDAFVLANKLLDDPKAMPKPARQQTLAAIARDARDVGATLGIMRRKPEEFLLGRRDRLCVRRKIDRAAVEARIAERTAARTAKDFARADEIRAELRERGVELMDTSTGTTWRVAG